MAGHSYSTGLSSETTYRDQTLVKYNSSGVEQWSKSWGGGGTDEARAIALDSTGNIYVAGLTNSTGLTTGDYDQTLLKFDSSGSIADCSSCVDRTTSEVDRTISEVDHATSEVDRTTSEVDRTTTEVNRQSPQTLVHCGGVASFMHSWGGDGTDQANAVALDSSGNIYLAGSVRSTGLSSETSGGDQTIIKYNSSGVEQWSKTWGGDQGDQANSIALDSSGNIYVAGYTTSTGLTAGNTDQTLVKYDSSGVEQWSKTWGGTGYEGANAVILDSSGNIYTVGYADSTGLTAGSSDQTLVKYDSSGVEQWSKTWGGTGSDQANALTLDSSGNIYVVGYSRSTGLSSDTNGDQTLVKYDSSGVEQWSKTWGGDASDNARGIGLDTDGNIYVAGTTSSTGLTAGSSDQTLVKYDSSGVEQWSKTWGGTNIDETYGLILDDSDNVFIAGRTNSTGLTSGSYDQTLVKYDSSGVEQWSKTWGGNSTDTAKAIEQDGSGNLYIAGSASSTGLSSETSYGDLTLIKTINDTTDCAGVCELRTTSEVDRTTSEVVRNEVPEVIKIDVGSPLNSVAQDTATTAPNSGVFRLRLALHDTVYAGQTGTEFKLQYAQKSGTCDTAFTGESYADITTSTPISYYDNTYGYDGQPMKANTNDPEHNNHTNVLQAYQEANNASLTQEIPIDSDGLWDFALTTDNAVPNTAFCLRLVTSADAQLGSYSVVPEITSPPLDFSQSNFRWFENATGSTFAETWGGNDIDAGKAVAVDSSGNIYVAGNTYSTGLTAGSADQTLVKYNSSGVEQWSKSWGGTASDSTYDMIIDTSGNIYVAGNSKSTGLVGDTTNGDQTLVKYNSSGVEQWSKSWGGSGADIAYALTLDTSGNIYVVGNSKSTGLVGDTTNGDQTLVKYNSSGVEQWSKSWGGSGADTAYALTLDTSGNIYVAGSTKSTGLSSETLYGDQTLVKYNSSGVEQWSKTWGGDSGDIAYALALDTSGNIYVAGSTKSTGLSSETLYGDQTLVKYNSSGVEQWSKSWGGDKGDNAYALTLDTSGNIYVAGSTASTGLTSGSSDQTLVKYNSSGVEQWSKSWGGNYGDVANALTLDTNGNIYVAGASNSTGLSSETTYGDQTLLVFDGSGSIADCSGICVDRTVTEVDRDATEVDRDTTEVDRTTTEVDRTTSEVNRESPQTLVHCGGPPASFMHTSGGTGDDRASTLALDTAGNIYVAGRTDTDLTVANYDQTLVKYDSSGVEQWTKTWGGGSTGAEYATSLTLDSFGNIYVAGYTDSAGLTAGSNDQTLVKYDSLGVEQWSKTWGGTGDDQARALVLDSSGNIYVAGYTGSTGLTAGSYDQTLVKYDSSGVEQWSKTWGGTGSDQAYALALDSSGNILIVGSSASTGLSSETSWGDQTLVKYDSSGVEQWSKTWGGTSSDVGYALTLDSSGNIYVAGSSRSSGLSSETSYGDQTLIKYDSSGAEQWSKTWGGDNYDKAYALALDSSGNIYVAGSTASTGLTAGSYDQTLIKYDSSGVEQWSKTWGGGGADEAYALALDSSGNLYVAGYNGSGVTTAGQTDDILIKTIADTTDCGGYCELRTTSEVDRTVTEVDRTTSEVDRTVTEVDRTTSEVDRTTSEVVRNEVPSTGASVGAPLADAHTAATMPSHDYAVRLRILLDPVKIAGVNYADLKLQYAPKIGTCDTSFSGESFSDIGSGTGFEYHDITGLADGDKLIASADDPTDSNTTVLQAYEESAPFTNPYSMTITGQSGLWDIPLSAKAEALGGSYCFRIVQNSNNSLLSTYSYVPELWLPPAMSQLMRHGQWFDVSETRQPFYWSSSER